MKTRTWNIPLVTFLSGSNAVLLRDENEVKEFIQQMNFLGIDVSSLASANAGIGLLVEFDNDKGVTCWNYRMPIGKAIQESTQWYGMDPYRWEDIKIESLSFAQLQNEYWKQLILQNAEANPNHPQLSEEFLGEVITNLLNDDAVWSEIDNSIGYYLEEEEK